MELVIPKLGLRAAPQKPTINDMRDAIFDYMQDRESEFVRADTVARAVKIKYRVAVQLLRELAESGKLVRRSNLNNDKVYAFKPDPIVAIAAPKFVKPFTPINQGLKMKLAMERCKQDRGGEYHAISMGGVGL